MTCRDFQSRISAFLEEDQNEDVRRLMEAHLAGCAGCAETMHGVRGVRAGLGKLERARPSADFGFALRGRLLMEARSRPGLRVRAAAWLFPTFPRSVLSGAFALAVLAGLALTLGPGRTPVKPDLPVAGPGSVPPARPPEIHNHYALERIPAAPHRGLAISSRAYRSRGDSLAAPRDVQTASIQYVRF